MKIPDGTCWAPPLNANHEKVDKNSTKTHVEAMNFKGDRVLTNEMLFLRDFGWWLEADYAVPIGDVGRLLEVLKVCIKLFDSPVKHLPRPIRTGVDIYKCWFWESQLYYLPPRLILPLAI
jgi:hypothetical protein